MVNAFESAIDISLEILNHREPPGINGQFDDVLDAQDAQDAHA
jgi:hypothetical protein